MQLNEVERGTKIRFEDLSREYAQKLDREDPLRRFRDEFFIPSKVDLKSKTLPSDFPQSKASNDDPCIYFCGNSLGLQPRLTSQLLQQHLSTWATKGVYGHFKPLDDSPLPTWVQADEVAAEQMAKVVGAMPSEVAVMGTLTGNLHLLMASFYRPECREGGRWKVIMEGKAFPSDHFAVESQIRSHNLEPSTALILINSPSPSHPLLTTSQILSTITQHASTTSLLLLPGIQYYTGQLFDIPTITAHAHSHGLLVGWDLAHAAGNVELQLHDWNVDFAVWCNYKYLNAGPGAIAGMFVHEKHGKVDRGGGEEGYRHRLGGWWGGDKKVRFQMENKFIPIPGAAGYQLSNPSIIDLTSVLSSLTLFTAASLPALRKKSLLLTSYLEQLLSTFPTPHPFTIITPSNPSERGAQLSIRLEPGLLEGVMRVLEEKGVVVDERKPDVVRAAPAPLYNCFEEVWAFVAVLREAVGRALEEREGKEEGVTVCARGGGKESKI
ncbi:MAG: Kynureninase (L-kynurenine hydrolase) [Trichoglossum hirsutum]|nr:MAG: Kynureninase (L-kynurenine hydrolase) [Trichoglossum hirsutum]